MTPSPLWIRTCYDWLRRGLLEGSAETVLYDIDRRLTNLEHQTGLFVVGFEVEPAKERPTGGGSIPPPRDPRKPKT